MCFFVMNICPFVAALKGPLYLEATTPSDAFSFIWNGVLFTMPTRGALAVTAMAQGHYPLVRDKVGAERLQRSPAALELLHDQGAAVQRLAGLDLESTRRLLRQVRK